MMDCDGLCWELVKSEVQLGAGIMDLGLRLVT